LETADELELFGPSHSKIYIVILCKTLRRWENTGSRLINRVYLSNSRVPVFWNLHLLLSAPLATPFASALLSDTVIRVAYNN
jgi:hypothetical protein